MIRLDRVLGELPAGGARPAVGDRDDEIMICPNMRAAQIYVRDPTPERMTAIVARRRCRSRGSTR